jgi:tRNA (cytidine/uridine-2'-O-)-methyltransferase
MDFQPIANVVLIAPEIPQNTGNVIRLCANVGARLHLVEPLGFRLENPGLRRASLDYSDLTDILVHNSIDELFQTISIDSVYGATIPGTVLYTSPRYKLGDTIVFGSESVGLPASVVDKLNFENRVHIPMMPANRSLNISNAAAIIVYEMWRQIGFSGASALAHENQAYFS